MTIPKELQDAWNKANANPGEAVPVGRSVACDDCSKDWTDDPKSGGFVFVSKAICPDCTPQWLRAIKRYHEESYIRAACPAGQSFADFVRAYRGKDAFMRITRG